MSSESVRAFAPRAWRARWGIIRLMAASAVLWVLLSDTTARLARLGLESLGSMDYVAAVQTLRAQERYGEALTLADEGLEVLQGAPRDELVTAREQTLAEQSSLLRRAGELAKGVILGVNTQEPSQQATVPVSIERLVGAVAADFFVIGDVRDLVIQTGRYISGKPTDPVIIALSGVGLLTTLAPEIDWAPSVLKAARRTGAMTRGLAAAIMDAAKTRRVRDIEAAVKNVATLSRGASPGGALRLLRLAEEPAELARLAGFVERRGRSGAAALLVTGRSGADALASADALKAAGKLDEAVRLEALIIKAGRKGEPGARWLRSGAYRSVIKPHVLVGLAKTLIKGTLPELLERAIVGLGRSAWWLLPLIAAWVLVELGLLVRATGIAALAKRTK